MFKKIAAIAVVSTFAIVGLTACSTAPAEEETTKTVLNSEDLSVQVKKSAVSVVAFSHTHENGDKVNCVMVNPTYKTSSVSCTPASK